ncbi:hypothetical protein [Cupriavidus necator]
MVIASTSLASGCASIVGGTTQVVSVEAHKAERAVEGARCEMVNSKGTYYVTTPGTAVISRAYGDLMVRCEKEGMDTGKATVISATKALVFGNALIGGAIGVAVDTSSGAAFDYPEVIRVIMGENAIIDARDNAAGNSPEVVKTSQSSGAASGGNGAPANLPSPPTDIRTPVQAAAREPKPVAMDDLRYLLPPR